MLKIVSHFKKVIYKVKRQLTNQEKMFIIYTTDKGLTNTPNI